MEKKSFNEQQENLVNSEIDYIKSILKEKGSINVWDDTDMYVPIVQYSEKDGNNVIKWYYIYRVELVDGEPYLIYTDDDVKEVSVPLCSIMMENLPYIINVLNEMI